MLLCNHLTHGICSVEVESELVRLYIFVRNAVEVAPHVNYALDPRARAYTTRTCIILSCTKWMSMSQFLTGDDD